jgi:hypothetical protein
MTKAGNGNNHNHQSILHKKGRLLACIYGGDVRQLVNWVVTARRKKPTTTLNATKIDIKAAYCRLHINAKIAAQSCT